MKWHFLLCFGSLVSAAADTNEIQVTATSATNSQTRGVTTIETFTRGGATNLVRRTKTKDGAVQIRMHRFYHDGNLVADYIAMPNTSGFTTEGGTPYSVSVEFNTNNMIKTVMIAKGGVLLDSFQWSDGLFQPIPSATIQRANDVGADLGKLFSPERIQNTTPRQFNKGVQDLIEKHKKE